MKVMLDADIGELVANAYELIEEKAAVKLSGAVGSALMQKVKQNDYPSETAKYRDMFNFFSVFSLF